MKNINIFRSVNLRKSLKYIKKHFSCPCYIIEICRRLNFDQIRLTKLKPSRMSETVR
jgi:hypothetical protein